MRSTESRIAPGSRFAAWTIALPVIVLAASGPGAPLIGDANTEGMNQDVEQRAEPRDRNRRRQRRVPSQTTWLGPRPHRGPDPFRPHPPHGPPHHLRRRGHRWRLENHRRRGVVVIAGRLHADPGDWLAGDGPAGPEHHLRRLGRDPHLLRGRALAARPGSRTGHLRQSRRRGHVARPRINSNRDGRLAIREPHRDRPELCRPHLRCDEYGLVAKHRRRAILQSRTAPESSST